MSPIEFYFSIINIILLVIMFIWCYCINYNYNKKINELMKITDEIKKFKEDINNEEQFYKTIISNLSDYLNLINKLKKQTQINKNTAPVSTPNPPIMKKEEKKEAEVIAPTNSNKTFFQKYFNFFNKFMKVAPKKEEKIVVEKIKNPAPPSTPIPIPTQNSSENANKGSGFVKKQQPQTQPKETEGWKKK